jgi:anti-anti-sigma regulatory factor
MLKISIEKSPRLTTLKLEGRLALAWVEELDRAFRAASAAPADGRIAVDLSDVTFVCEEGKRLLEQMHSGGAKLKGSGCVTRSLVEGIQRTTHHRDPR